MTCIIGKVLPDGTIYMAGDRMASDGKNHHLYDRPKVFHNGDFMFGYTYSFRMGQLLEFSWKQPNNTPSSDAPNSVIYDYVYTTLLESFKNLFTEHDCDINGGEVFMFAFAGKLFTVQGDWSMFEHKNCHAIGCGVDVVLGAMYYANKCVEDKTLSFSFDADRSHIAGMVKRQLKLSIEAAASIKAGVSIEHDIISKIYGR